jgi:hypothetical protein
MMRAMTVTLSIGVALTLAACANTDTPFSLGDLSAPTAALPAKPAADPACVALAQRIDALRKEGVVERVESAAKGKGTTVSVKRASLSQIAELEKANSDFQAKCSTVPRSAMPAQPTVTPAQPPAKTASIVAPIAKAPAQPQRSGGE